MNNAQDLISYAKISLKDTTEQSEIQPLCRIIFSHIMGWNLTALLLHLEDPLGEKDIDRFRQIIGRLADGEPIQYILGYEDFHNFRFKVNEYTLIPRPETSELIDWIASGAQGCETVLDIGTGSGCIAVSLAKVIEGADVYACDISEGALSTAKENAAGNGAAIRFFQCDILQWQKYVFPQFDIIVSNPPYVLEKEAQTLTRRVREYEPETALFVPDNDPLIFYKAIADMGKRHLKNGGRIWFEINEAMGEECENLLKEKGFKDIVLHKDSFGKQRFITAICKYV